MKKRNSKKGFTLVELVIVIAVIAILASVLIPTFGSIITKANESAAQQNAVNIYREVYARDLTDGVLDGNEGKNADGSAKAITYTGSDITVAFSSGWTVTVTVGSSTAVYNGTTCTVTTN